MLTNQLLLDNYNFVQPGALESNNELPLNGKLLTDADLTLDNRVGTPIFSTDNGSNLFSSELFFTGNSPSPLSTNSFGGFYSVVIQSYLTLATDPGETLGSAFDLGVLSPNETLEASDRVGFLDTADIYRFSIDSSVSLEAQLSGLSRDIDLALLDSNGDVIGTSNNAWSQDELISQDLGAGTYYLVVYPYAFRGSEFSLELTASTPAESPEYNPISGYGEARVDLALEELLETDVPTVDPIGGNSVGLDRIGAPAAWEMDYTGDGTIVAVIDTGVDLDHLDLDNNIWVNSDEIPDNGIDDDGNGYVDDVNGWDFVSNDNDPDDGNGHGTHVAGTIAAEDNNLGISGVAPDAQIMPVKVLSDSGSGFTSDIAEGIRYAADNGADVINLSLGGGGVSQQMNTAIQYATDMGSVVVMAAGNSGGDSPEQPGAFAVEEGIVVGAVDNTGDLADFSNRAGDAEDYLGDGLDYPSYVTAFGVNVFSTLPDDSFGKLSGTSMATPHVAGAAAILMGADPSLTPEEVTDLMTATAVDSDASLFV